MKKILLLLIIMLAAYWSHLNKSQLAEHWQTVLHKIKGAEPSEQIVGSDSGSERTGSSDAEHDTRPELPPTPSVPKPSRVQASSPKPITIPPNVYYAKERLSVVSEAGVTSIAKGARVEKVEEVEGKYLVDDGNTKLLAAPWKLTRDPVEIAALTLETAPIQTVSGNTTRPSAPTSQKVQVEETKPSSSRSTEILEIQAQIVAVDRQISNYQVARYNESVALSTASYRGRPTSTFKANMAKYDGQIAALENQRASLVQALTRLR